MQATQHPDKLRVISFPSEKLWYIWWPRKCPGIGLITVTLDAVLAWVQSRSSTQLVPSWRYVGNNTTSFTHTHTHIYCTYPTRRYLIYTHIYIYIVYIYIQSYDLLCCSASIPIFWTKYKDYSILYVSMFRCSSLVWQIRPGGKYLSKLQNLETLKIFFTRVSYLRVSCK